MARLAGAVKWLDDAKGVGLVAHEGGPDVLAHFGPIQAEGFESLQAGDAVELEIVQGDEGPEAANVSRAS